jgi:protein tyrosine phosphatase (PTP) superfamily phosphohydrolase (DUF442 family)
MKSTLAATVGLLVLVVIVVLGPLVWQYFPNYNWRTVEEGVFYGSRQMGGAALERAIEEYGIGTVINFRGSNEGTDWYDEEVAACRKAGAAHVSFSWSKNSLPDPESLLRFIALMESGEKPFLAHCQGGTHRTGAAAAVYRLLKGETPEAARGEFKLGFNDAPIGELVDLYEASGMSFREWATEAYPAAYQSWKKRSEAKKKQQESATREFPRRGLTENMAA